MSDEVKYRPYCGTPAKLSSDLIGWASNAAPGSWAVYHIDTGKLMWDERHWLKVVHPVLDEAYQLYTAGLVYLFQRKFEDGSYEYLMQRSGYYNRRDRVWSKTSSASTQPA